MSTVPPFVQNAINRLEGLIQQVDALTAVQHGVVGYVSPSGQSKTYGPMVKNSYELELRIVQAVTGIAPKSIYATNVNQVEFASGKAAVAKALLADLKDGHFNDLHDLAHAELFSDFSDMAKELLSNGYRIAAAVVVGSSNESHLRQLAQKHGVAVTGANGKPLNGGALNDELAKAQVYDKNVQKQILAWQGIRNDAAHGQKKDGDFTDTQIQTMIDGIRDFMARFPA